MKTTSKKKKEYIYFLRNIVTILVTTISDEIKVKKLHLQRVAVYSHPLNAWKDRTTAQISKRKQNVCCICVIGGHEQIITLYIHKDRLEGRREIYLQAKQSCSLYVVTGTK